MKAVSLQDIVGELTSQLNEGRAYLDVQTGEVIHICQNLLWALEDDPHEGPAPDQETEDEYQLARRVVEDGSRYFLLPSKFDIHEWAIMRDFAQSLEDEALREELLDAIHGRGAFRSFKNSIRRSGIEQAWYRFRDRALAQIAIHWFQLHGIPYVDDMPEDDPQERSS